MTTESNLRDALLAHVMATAREHAVDASPVRDKLWKRLRAAGWRPALGHERQEPPKHASDSELVRLFLAGSEPAFGQLYQRHADDLFGYAVRKGLSEDEAEDALQDTFLTLYRKADGLDEHPDLRGYLFVTMRNMAFQRFRSRARRASLNNDVVAPSTDSAAAIHQGRQLEDLAHALDATCDEFDQEIVLLTCEGYTSAEIGGMLDMTSENVRVRLYRARKRLQAALETQ